MKPRRTDLRSRVKEFGWILAGAAPLAFFWMICHERTSAPESFRPRVRAIQRGPDSDIVYRVRDERADIVPVQVLYSDEKIAALTGVEAGDLIVVEDTAGGVRPGRPW